MNQPQQIIAGLNSWSSRLHLKLDIDNKRDEIFAMENECGSCSLWMTQQCKMERVRLVSSRECKCSDFQMDSLSKENLELKRAQLREMQERLGKMKEKS